MAYLVLARKWRPQVFEEIVGQEHVTRALMNAIRLDRVAHAFLFTGARGVGTELAAASGQEAADRVVQDRVNGMLS